MVESNLLSVFKPAQAKDYEYQECIPCTSIQAMLSFVLGGYLQSDTLFKENGKIDLKKHPIMWQKSVKLTGLGLFGFGFWRLYEVYNMYTEKR